MHGDYHLAQVMRNEGKIIACDASEGRLELLKENLQRLGVEMAQVAQAGQLLAVEVLRDERIVRRLYAELQREVERVVPGLVQVAAVHPQVGHLGGLPHVALLALPGPRVLGGV